MALLRKRTDRRRLLRGRYLLVWLAALTVLVLVTGSRLLAEIEALKAAPRDNVQWTLSQLEVDLLLLDQAIRRASTAPETLTAVRKRFDLFYSRVDTLTKGSAFAELRSGSPGPENLLELQTFLKDSITLIDGDDDALQRELEPLAARTRELAATVKELSLKGVKLYAAASDARRNTFTSTLVISIYVSGGLILLLGVLMVFLGRQSRISQERARDSDRARRRVTATVNASLDAVVVADGKGMVIDWNDAASEVFGYPRDKVMGREMADLIVPESLREAHRAGMARFLATGVKHVVDSGRLELTALRADGTEFPVELSIVLAEQDDGAVFVSYLRDISARLAGERALTEARDAAMAADKAKSEFLAVMSHEMRTPLNGVLGVLDLLEDTELTSQQRKYVAAAVNSGEILLHHINDVLDITRIEADRMVFDSAPVDLAALLRDTVGVTAPIAEANGNSVSISDDLQGGHYLTDEHRLRQILLNLLGNAAKFTSDGAIIAGIRRLEVNDGLEMIEFAINDSGPGIAPEDRERIFEDFVTLDPSYDRKTSGSGLGLAIVRRIAQAMGGEMGVGSSILGGARFWFRLPLERTERAPRQVPTPVIPSKGQSRILLVEDNSVNRMVVREILESAGHEIVEAEHGQEGVLVAGRERFDLILMDVSMPVMDGVTATQAIRDSQGLSRDTPIVGLTAHAMPEERSRFLAAGMRDCLIKPVRRADLLEIAGRFSSRPMPVPDKQETDDQIVDEEVIADLSAALSASKLSETIGKVTAELEAGPDKLHSLADDDAFSQIAELAHRLAGSAAIVGGRSLQKRLAAIQNAGKSADARQVADALEGLEEHVEKLTQILREFSAS